MSERDQTLFIKRIVDRAVYLRCDYASRITMMMDLEAAVKHFNLRLEELLNAAVADFMHDVQQIGAHINRATKTFDLYFGPRFAGKES